MKKDFTIDFWVKPASTQQTYADIIDFNHRTNVGIVIQQTENFNNNFGFYIGNGSSGVGITHQLQANVWQHLVFEREGTNLRLYVNGSLVGTKSCFDGDIYFIPDSNVTVAYNMNYGRYFNGQIRNLTFTFAPTDTSTTN